VIVYLNAYIQLVIDKYGNINKLLDEYIFPIVDHSTNQEEVQRQLLNFVKFVNQNFSKYAKHIGIKENLSTYWARRSFATQAI
jgi:integrase/recombinase XerD